MWRIGSRSRPENPGRPRSGHSRTTARSKLRSKPAGSSPVTEMVSIRGRKPSDAGWGSRLKMAVPAPSCRASSANPSSEPIASPSGAVCEVISMRLIFRKRVTTADGSRVTSLIAPTFLVPFVLDRLTGYVLAFTVPCALRPVACYLVQDALDAVRPLEPLVAPELQVRGVVDAHAPPALASEEAARLLKPSCGCTGGVV